MKLMKVDIEGFRSIEKMTIDFDGSGHNVLVGKNESGKSNILKALSLLSDDNEFTDKDKKLLYQGGINMVKFFLALEDSEIQHCVKKSIEKFVANPKTVRDLIVTHLDVTFRVTQGKRGWDVTPNSNENSDGIPSEWYIITEAFADTALRVSFKNSLLSGNYIHRDFMRTLVHQTNAPTVRKKLTSVPLSEVISVLSALISKVLNMTDYRFPVAYWRYNAQNHTIPPSVAREAFSQNPSSCAPLQNMFLLAKIPSDKIRDSISEANGADSNFRKSVLDRVTHDTNEYIKQTWKEFNDVRIELFPDGPNIGIGIRDELNTYNFDQRSDGFRRFVSFLLLLSATLEKDSKQANSPLILIDEPETSLHPSGARDFRDKLIELGKENVVVYSTHSPSMVDNTNIERNLIVKKNRENTIITNVNEHGVSSAENVYNVIGHSIYTDLKATNILLEGYTDKKTIGLFIETSKLSDLGLCYTNGVGSIEHVTSILKLARRKYFILSDADDEAVRKKTKMGEPNHWFTYSDLGSDAVTLEDFYKSESILATMNEVLSSHQIDFDGKFTMPESNRVIEIRKLIKAILPSGNDVAAIMKQIKMKCIENITKANVDSEKINRMLDALHQKITETQNT